MSIKIRTLRPDEISKWLDFMCNEVFPDDPREAVESMWHDDPAKDFSGIFIAVDDHDNIVASVKAACKNVTICGMSVRAGIISGVGTRRNYRGQGLITQLFDICRQSMIERGVRIFHLYSNPDTLTFYLHNGYLALPQRPGETFHRMYQVISPFSIGKTEISDTASLIALLTQAET